MNTLGERCPELRRLRDRLYARIIDCDNLPAEWVRLLYNLPDTVPVWSRTDALLVAAVYRTSSIKSDPVAEPVYRTSSIKSGAGR